MDEKYDILHHPNVSLTTDGGAKPYVHGFTEQAQASIVMSKPTDEESTEISIPAGIEKLDLILLSEEEVLEMVEKSTN